jgi:hypothetical protein
VNKVRKYTEKDLDRSWSSEEVAALSEGEITKLAFLRDYKNFIFFIPIAIVLYSISRHFGMIGKIAGWIGVVMFGLFALQGLCNTGVVFISLIGTPFLDKTAPAKILFWKSVQLLISFGNFAIFAVLALVLLNELYDLNLHKYVPWWK